MKLIKHAALLISILISTGCLHFQHYSGFTSTGLNPNNGLVVANIRVNSDSLSRYHKNWNEIVFYSIPKDESLKPERYSLRGKINDDGIARFYGQIPEGTYRIVMFQSQYHSDTFSAWMTHPAGFASLKFDVKKEETTDLGTFIYQAFNTGSKKSRWDESGKSLTGYFTHFKQYNPDIVSELASSNGYIKQDIKNFNTNYSAQENVEEPLEKLLNISQENSWQTKYLVSNDKLISIGKLGGFNYKTEGGWKTGAVPTIESLIDVAYLDNQYAFIDSKGTLFTSTDLSKPAIKVHDLKHEGSLFWLSKSNDSGYALTENKEYLFAYQFSSIASSWNEIGRIKKSVNIFKNNVNTFAILDADNRLNVFTDGDLYIYSNDKKWEKMHSENLTYLSRQQNGNLTALKKGVFTSNIPIISVDQGRNWIELERKVHDNFTDAKSSPTYVLATNKVISLGSPEKKEKGTGRFRISNSFNLLSATIPNGSSEDEIQLSELAKMDESCTRLLSEYSTDEQLFVLCKDHKIMRSSDLGTSWQNEHQLMQSDLREQFEQTLKLLTTAQ